MKRIMLVIGARPNMMKAAALMHVMEGDPRFTVSLVHTGQHYDSRMSQIFFEDLQLPEPDVFLGVEPGTPNQQIGHILLSLEPKVKEFAPDLVVVVGDVNSTLAAAIVANKLGIELAHVEAGLRSFDRSMPEEHNRLVVDNLADYLFTPSGDADENLLKEGISQDRIYFVGNVMVDTLLRFSERARALKAWQEYGVRPQAYALMTMHRPANVDDCDALVHLLDILTCIQEHLPVIFPTHPRTLARLDHFGLTARYRSLPNLIETPPLGYLPFVNLMQEAKMVLTDSGGIQEETTVLGVPCLTLRENTERPITISQGTNHVVGVNLDRIMPVFHQLLNNGHAETVRVPEGWDGRAAERIAQVLAQ
jgi:UDP-N-acetylglucosamine 2-epimerase (non-hydrolysing)